MSAPILTSTDKVVYLGGNSYLEMIGFTKGKEYSLIKYEDGALLIKATISAFDLPLVLGNGKPTDFFANFKKVA